jgi:hypothetical protein
MLNSSVSERGEWDSLLNLDSSELVLDASAFYAGIPFLSSSKCYTTNLVLKEVIHIKKSYSALEFLIDAGNLEIIEEEQFLEIFLY